MIDFDELEEPVNLESLTSAANEAGNERFNGNI